MLQGGKYARPPVSRMGNKHGYGLALLRVMGLRPGQGADRYLWCEPDPGCRALLHAYTDREVMQEAARIIRSWKDEEPRALWERLRAEGPIRVGEAREVARHCYLSMGSFSQKGVDAGIGTPEGKEPSHNFGGLKPVAEQLLGTIPRAPTLPANVTPDARAIEPHKAPEWLLDVLPRPTSADRANSGALHSVTTCKHRTRLIRRADGAHIVSGEHGAGVAFASLRCAVGDLVRDVLLLRAPCEICGGVVVSRPVEVANDGPRRSWSVERLADEGGEAAMNAPPIGANDKPSIPVLVDATLEWSPAVDGADIPSRGNLVLGSLWNRAPFSHTATISGMVAPVPKGAVIYADPPYLNTTGYGNDLPRQDVVNMARRWAEAGARVYISEAEPLPALVADGWHAVEITSQRIGQKRTFSKQQREWVTCSVPPAGARLSKRRCFEPVRRARRCS
jgi:hypothetical protein